MRVETGETVANHASPTVPTIPTVFPENSDGGTRLDPALVRDYIVRTVIPTEQDRITYATTTKIIYHCASRFGDGVKPVVPGLLASLENEGVAFQSKPDCWRLSQ